MLASPPERCHPPSDIVILNGTNSDSLVGFNPTRERFTMIRIPFPLGMFSRGLLDSTRQIAITGPFHAPRPQAHAFFRYFEHTDGFNVSIG